MATEEIVLTNTNPTLSLGASTSPSLSSQRRLVSEDAEAESPGSELKPVDRGKDAWLFVCYLSAHAMSMGLTVKQVASACLLEMMVWGFPFSFGVVQQYLTTHPPFNTNSSVANGLSGTVLLGWLYVSMFVNIQIFGRYPEKIKPAVWVSIFACAAGLVLSSFATTVWQLVICQGALFGMGGGVVTISYILWLFEWFAQRRGLATGIVFAGACVGGTIFPPILGALMQRIGFPWTMRIWGGMFALVCGVASLGNKPRLPLPPKGSPRAPLFPRDVSFLRSPTFYVMMLTIALQGLGYLSVSLYISTFAVSLGYSESYGQLALSIFNICAFFSQTLLGWASDRFSYTYIILISATSCALTALLLWGFASSIALVLVFASVFAMAGGGMSAIWPSASTEIARKNPQQAGLIFTLFSVSKGVAAVAGPAIAGSLHDPTTVREAYGQYGFSHMVVFVGATMVAACFGSVATQYIRTRTKAE